MSQTQTENTVRDELSNRKKIPLWCNTGDLGSFISVLLYGFE